MKLEYNPSSTPFSKILFSFWFCQVVKHNNIFLLMMKTQKYVEQFVDASASLFVEKELGTKNTKLVFGCSCNPTWFFISFIF